MSTKRSYTKSKDPRNFVEQTAEKLELKCNSSDTKNYEVVELSEEEKQFIQIGLDDSKNGQVISSLEAKEMAEECFK